MAAPRGRRRESHLVVVQELQQGSGRGISGKPSRTFRPPYLKPCATNWVKNLNFRRGLYRGYAASIRTLRAFLRCWRNGPWRRESASTAAGRAHFDGRRRGLGDRFDGSLPGRRVSGPQLTGERASGRPAVRQVTSRVEPERVVESGGCALFCCGVAWRGVRGARADSNRSERDRLPPSSQKKKIRTDFFFRKNTFSSDQGPTVHLLYHQCLPTNIQSSQSFS